MFAALHDRGSEAWVDGGAGNNELPYRDGVWHQMKRHPGAEIPNGEFCKDFCAVGTVELVESWDCVHEGREGASIGESVKDKEFELCR